MKKAPLSGPDAPHAYRPVRVTSGRMQSPGSWTFQLATGKPCRTCGGSERVIQHLVYTPKRRVTLASALAAIAAYEVPA